jgi:hypothetical protein
MIWLILALFVGQEGASAEVKQAYVSAMVETQRRATAVLNEEIAQLEKQILQKKNFRLNPSADNGGEYVIRGGNEFSGYEFPERRFAIASIQEDVVRLEKLKAEQKKMYDRPAAVLAFNELKKGQVGFLGDGRDPYKVTVFQVLSDNRALVKVLGETVLVLNLNTSELVDGKEMTTPLIVEVEGSQRYNTVAGGSNTVMAARALSLQEMQDVIAYAKENGPKRPLNLRSWKDNAGKVIMKGEFVRKDEKMVVVLDENRQEREIEWVKLSRPDRLFVDKNK